MSGRHFFQAGTVAGFLVGCVLAAILCTQPSRAQSVGELRHKLERLPGPWNERVHRITQTEYEQTFRFWAGKHPEERSFGGPQQRDYSLREGAFTALCSRSRA